MARPVDKAKRIDIAQRAVEFIREKGVHRSSMSDIAKALGMKRPTLYWYFKDLGEIFLTILDHTLTQQASFVAERLRGVTHPIDVLDTYILACRDFYADDEDFIILLFQMWAAGRSDPSRIFERTNTYFEQFRDLAIDLLKVGMEAGLVGECNPEVLIDLVSALIDGMMVHRVVRGIDVGGLHEMFSQSVLRPLRLEPP